MWICRNVSKRKYINESINKILRLRNKRLKMVAIAQLLPWFVSVSHFLLGAQWDIVFENILE
jgi:hypothetical protein